VDVVGFTELGERVEAGELKAIAARLAEAASSLIEPPVRLVKTVDDAILLMSRETGPLLDVLAKLMSRLADDRDLPAVHVGVARGPAHVGGADVYGAPVNLASRLTDLAPTRRVWADEPVVATSRDSTRWHVRGPTTVKGLQAPVIVFEFDPTGTAAD